MEAPTLTGLTLAAEADRWRAAAFAVEDGRTRIGAVTMELAGVGAGSGIVGWSLDRDGVEIDGLPPSRSPSPADAVEHPNGATRIDHVVALTPDLERTTAACEAAGIVRRRVREVGEGDEILRQGFFRLGEVILELVEGSHTRAEPDAPARFWGLVCVVPDVDELAGSLGELLGSPKDAVQPGRRIVTARREAALGLPVAFITPDS